MKSDNQELTKDQLNALKSRWSEKDPDGDGTAQSRMIRTLKDACRNHSDDRPVGLDLRGITLYHEDLSGLDLSGYDLSYAT
jgi:uncharacterized protein YjbI with pentapeptide repeats